MCRTEEINISYVSPYKLYSMKKLIIIIIVIAVALLAYYIIAPDRSPDKEMTENMERSEVSEDINRLPITIKKTEEMMEITLPYQGTLNDVTGGNASGIAKSGIFEGEYFLSVTFENLPDLDPGYFYEGWVVRKLPFDFISTGVLTRTNGQWVNMYMSLDTGLLGYPDYVLTLEPDDGDPDPAGHVLEGTMGK